VVFMAAWYNGKESKFFDITAHNYDTNTMLKEFWLDPGPSDQGPSVPRGT